MFWLFQIQSMVLSIKPMKISRKFQTFSIVLFHPTLGLLLAHYIRETFEIPKELFNYIFWTLQINSLKKLLEISIFSPYFLKIYFGPRWHFETRWWPFNFHTFPHLFFFLIFFIEILRDHINEYFSRTQPSTIHPMDCIYW